MQTLLYLWCSITFLLDKIYKHDYLLSNVCNMYICENMNNYKIICSCVVFLYLNYFKTSYKWLNYSFF